MSIRFQKAIEYTQKYKHQLKPCKYCRNTDIRITSDRTIFPTPKNVWGVVCSTKNCHCTGAYSRVKDAIKAWNKIN